MPAAPSTAPDLKKPPAYVQGSGGGPGVPATDVITAVEKMKAKHFADMLENLAAVLAIGAGILIDIPPAAGLLGASSGTAWLAANYWSGVADDPPKSYKKIVTFERRTCSLARPADRSLSRLRILSQQCLFMSVTASGLLDAIERERGAAAKNDADWAILHHGVALQARDAIRIDLARTAAALLAFADALRTSRYRRPLIEGSKRHPYKQLTRSGSLGQMKSYLAKSGLERREIQGVLEWWNSGSRVKQQTHLTPKQLASQARALYAGARQW